MGYIVLLPKVISKNSEQGTGFQVGKSM